MHKKEIIFSAKKLFIGYSANGPVLKNIDLEIYKGQYCALLGSNGSGKTTFIRSIAGLMPSISGSLQIGENTSISMVPQFKKMKLEYPLTVREVIFLSGKFDFLFRKKSPITDKQLTILKEIGVYHLLNKLIRECSGGELQKILIARSLLSGAELIFLDEPMDALDNDSRIQISHLLLKYSKENKTTFFIITHNIEKTFIDDFDRVFQIKDRILKEVKK